MESEDGQNQIVKKNKWHNRPISLWLAVVLMLASFVGGILSGGGSSVEASKIIIKGAEAGAVTTTEVSAAGHVTGTSAALLPAYLKKDVNFQLYWDTWNLIKSQAYAKDVVDTKMFYGSLQGLVASLGDPYSVFLTPTDANQFQQDLAGNFEGIGAEIAVKNNQLLIVSPLDGMPAMDAGLRAKDWIIKINGTSTDGMSSAQAVSLIRGPKDTKVTLTIYRDGFAAPQDFQITRKAITVKSLSLEYLDSGRIAHIKVRQFNDDTIPLFDAAINDLTGKSYVKGIILDLRDNPGGYLESAVQMAGEWDGTQTVVSEKNRDGVETKHAANIDSRLSKYKTVVLVNGGSASASEIVSGALKDWGKATIVGTKTFGKGSVQELDTLSDGSQVKLTIAKWFTPKGVNIDLAGIEPDVKVDLTEDDYNKDKDPQLAKAIELAR